MEKTLKPIDSSFKEKYVAYSHELFFGIIPFSIFIYIETLNSVSSDAEVNEFEFLGAKSDKLVDALKLLGLTIFFRIF